LHYKDLLGSKIYLAKDKGITLDPFQTVWLSNL